MPSLIAARDAVVAAKSERPSVLICRTVKGIGMGPWATRSIATTGE